MTIQIAELSTELQEYIIDTHVVCDILVAKWSTRTLIIDSDGRYVLHDAGDEFCGITESVDVSEVPLSGVRYSGKVIHFDGISVSL